jgi:hypothetical protein
LSGKVGFIGPPGPPGLPGIPGFAGLKGSSIKGEQGDDGTFAKIPSYKSIIKHFVRRTKMNNNCLLINYSRLARTHGTAGTSRIVRFTRNYGS